MIKSRKMSGMGYVARMGSMRSAYQILVLKPRVRDHFEDLGVDGREDNVKTFLQEIAWDVVEWIHPAYDMVQWRVLLNAVMNLRVL
jgi:hypothetical protein